MTIVVCVDNKGGILFNRRRVSSDRMVTADIISLAGNKKIYIRSYSATLFPGDAPVCVSENYLMEVKPGEILFLEDFASEELLEKAEKCILYRWNRNYPSDVRFPVDWLLNRGRLESVVEFPGHSHERITREVYIL